MVAMKRRADESSKAQLKRLQQMFPSATPPIMEQMIKIFQGREGLIKATLISLGYKRAVDGPGDRTSAPPSLENSINLMMAKPASRKLFDKLTTYFPNHDEMTIKRTMFELKESEHDVIIALVANSNPEQLGSKSRKGRGKRQQEKSNAMAKADIKEDRDEDGAIMRLRYLKTVFPDCEETTLYHELYCLDLNVQRVIEEMEKRGHKSLDMNEILKNRKKHLEETKAMTARQRALRSGQQSSIQKSSFDPVQAHKARPKTRLNEAKAKELIKQESPFQHIDLNETIRQKIADLALEAADNNESVAKDFIRQEQDQLDEARYLERYQLYGELERDHQFVRFPCKQVQQSDSEVGQFMAPEFVLIPREVIESTTSVALPKVDASTSTGQDLEPDKISLAKGPASDLARGSIFDSLRNDETKRKSLRSQVGERIKLAIGHKKITSESTCRESHRIGPDLSLRVSRLDATRRIGRNTQLVKREHPLFMPLHSRMQPKQ